MAKILHKRLKIITFAAEMSEERCFQAFLFRFFTGFHCFFASKLSTIMFRNIEIERFRGIDHSRIDGLKLVNLFFGKNNCGKSSLLDSIFLISGLSNPKLPLNVNILRNYRRLDKSDLLLDFYALDTSRPILIKAQNEEMRELSISLLETSNSKINLLSEENNVATTDAESDYGLSMQWKINGTSYASDIILSRKSETELEQKVRLDARYNERLSCRYLTSKFDFYTSIEGLVNVMQNKDEKFIVDALKVIEPNLKDFVLWQNEVLVDAGYEKRIPINMMGDGARKILSILTTIYECKQGVVLIDEISNGFHHSVMKDLWKCIVSAAEKNQVQIYATTHDIDSIRGLRDAMLEFEGPKDAVAFFKLQKTKACELKSYHYSLGSVDYSLNQEIELR